MLAKYKRLRTKDVIFLTKKKNYFGNGFFGFFYVEQYPNRKYNQVSCHVSIKYSKHSTARNILKRAIIQQTDKLIKDGVIAKDWKILVSLNKSKIPILQKEFENMEKKNIIKSIQNYFTQSFIALSKHLGKSGITSSTMGKRY